jgi:hypothetical protein
MNLSAETTSPPDGGLSPRRRPASFLTAIIGSLLIVLAVVAYYWWLWGSLSGFVQALDFYGKPFGDFAIFYYKMGRRVLASGGAVPGFYYSPGFAVALGVFGLFGPQTALILWGGTQALAVGGLAVLSHRGALGPRLSGFVLSLLLVLTSFPVLHNFAWGQASIFLVLALIAGLLLAERERWVGAALFLSLAACIKYYPVVFLLPLLIRKNWKPATLFLGITAILTVITPVVVLGWQETIALFAFLLRKSHDVQLAAGGPNSQYVVNVLMRWFNPPREWIEPARLGFATMGFLIVEANVIVMFLLRRLNGVSFTRWSFLLLFLSIPFFVSTSWPHYLVYIPFCQLFLYRELAREKTGWTITGGALKVLLAISVALSSVFAFQLMGSWQVYNGWGLLFVSNGMMLGIAYVVLMPSLREELRRHGTAKSIPAPEEGAG